VAREKAKKLSPKHKLALRLYACGYSEEEAAAAVGLTQPSISYVVDSDVGRAYLEKLNRELEGELQRQFGEVVNVIKSALRCGDPKIQLAAAGLWSRLAGRQKIKVELSAEDVVRELMQGKDVQIEEQPKGFIEYEPTKTSTTGNRETVLHN